MYYTCWVWSERNIFICALIPAQCPLFTRRGQSARECKWKPFCGVKLLVKKKYLCNYVYMFYWSSNKAFCVKRHDSGWLNVKLNDRRIAICTITNYHFNYMLKYFMYGWLHLNILLCIVVFIIRFAISVFQTDEWKHGCVNNMHLITRKKANKEMP